MLLGQRVYARKIPSPPGHVIIILSLLKQRAVYTWTCPRLTQKRWQRVGNVSASSLPSPLLLLPYEWNGGIGRGVIDINQATSPLWRQAVAFISFGFKWSFLFRHYSLLIHYFPNLLGPRSRLISPSLHRCISPVTRRTHFGGLWAQRQGGLSTLPLKSPWVTTGLGWHAAQAWGPGVPL